MFTAIDVITSVLEPGILGETKGAARIVAIDVLEHLEAVGFQVVLGGEWQPIETAPKDGTRFQAGHFYEVSGHFRQFVCFWNPGWKGVEGVSEAGPFWQGGGLLEHPTHWMPLPHPPHGAA